VSAHAEILHHANDLHVRDLRAGRARDRLAAQVRPARPDARTTLTRTLMAAVAAVSVVLGPL
jgi:hypothetical protein